MAKFAATTFIRMREENDISINPMIKQYAKRK